MEIWPGETSEIKRRENHSLLSILYSLQGRSHNHTAWEEHSAEGMTKKLLQAYAFYADAWWNVCVWRVELCVCVCEGVCNYYRYVLWELCVWTEWIIKFKEMRQTHAEGLLAKPKPRHRLKASLRPWWLKTSTVSDLWLESHFGSYVSRNSMHKQRFFGLCLLYTDWADTLPLFIKI